jgi:hypothetical protein
VRLHLLPFTALMLVGCQAGKTPVTTTVETSESATFPVGAPVRTEPSEIALVHRGHYVTVGMTAEDAFKTFADTHVSGFETDQLPPAFKDPYRARTWEDGQHGFGVILFRDRVVASMYQEESSTLARLNEMVDIHRAHLGDVPPVTITGKQVNYWFWDKDGQRLMICGYQPREGQVKVTCCMGDSVVLDGLQINEVSAHREQQSLDASSVNLKR